MSSTQTTFNEDEARILSIMRTVSAPVSVIASITIIVLIARSRAKLTTTQNRLLVGLSVSDIISSLSMTFTSLPMPRGTPNVWLALGNRATCELQGFFFVFGGLITPSYNVALCIYFLLKVRYNINDETVRSKVEPFLHGIPIMNALIFSIYCLIKDFYNPAEAMCYITDFPRNCSLKSSDVPCERGGESTDDWVVRYGVFYMSTIPFIIFGTMITLYITVLRQEQRMGRFGRGALNLTPTTNNGTTSSHMSTTQRRRSHYLKMTMYRALAYSIAWLIPFLGIMIQTPRQIMDGSPTTPPFPLQLYNSIFYPLQGFFNFLVFIYPRVLHERQQNPNYSLCEAITAALKINITIPFFKRWERKRSHQSMIVRSENDVVDEGDDNDDEEGQQQIYDACGKCTDPTEGLTDLGDNLTHTVDNSTSS